MGHAEVAGEAGKGGQGGADTGGCEPRPLGSCEGCPKHPDDFDLASSCGISAAGFELGVDRYASDCDGVVVVVWGNKPDESFAYYSTSYSFDRDGKLIGYSSTDDVADDCSGVGTECRRVGAAESLCPEGGYGGQGGAGGEAGAPGGGQGGSRE